jgi:chemotaxis signal transduction protein
MPISLPMGETHDLLIFHTSGLHCAFPLAEVREIVPMATLYFSPGLPSALAGFLDLRGTPVPIIRLDRLFGLPEQTPGLHTPMIVLRGVLGPVGGPIGGQGGGLVGVSVDSVRSIVPAPTSWLLAIPPDLTFGGCTTAVFQLDGDLISLLSPAALLTANEDRLLADYIVMSQARLLQLGETP